jgi:hypothetical protein
MSVLIGVWGGIARRPVVERFLIAQFWGSSIVMLGFAMLTVVVPWMKIEDAPDRSAISYDISTIIFEIRKWTTSNEFAFQYANEVFTWILFVLSLGFAVQFGLFPFHSPQMRVLGGVASEIIPLYLVGFVSMSAIGWWRIVLPLYPELLGEFGWLALIPSLSGAIWGGIRALVAPDPRQKLAFLSLTLWGLSVLASCSLSRLGMSGAWVMQQQLTILFSIVVLALGSPADTNAALPSSSVPPGRISNRTLLLCVCVPALGLFGSGYMIVVDLSRTGLLLAAMSFIIGAACCSAICSLRTNIRSIQNRGVQFVMVALIAVIANLLPGLLLHQCENEFARTFRRFERPIAAVSAEADEEDRQSPP